MAKKTVASVQAAGGKDFIKCIKAVKDKRKGSYSFEQKMVHKDNAKKFFDHD
ncbi:MAG: DUF4295 domain-containing protein [Bacteroidota bacterium]